MGIEQTTQTTAVMGQPFWSDTGKVMKLSEYFKQARLSQAEQRVTKYLLQGFSNKEIAEKCTPVVTEKTIKFHLTQIFSKTKCKTRTELIAKVLPLYVIETIFETKLKYFSIGSGMMEPKEKTIVTGVLEDETTETQGTEKPEGTEASE